MSDNAKAKLLSILQARGIPLVLDDISWAFESEATRPDAIAWVEEYLDDATLLTKDELAFYETIGDSSKLEFSTASHDVVPLQDRDIREAITALKSSTSAIENHAKSLDVQREVLMMLSGRSQSSTRAANISTKYAQESSSLNFAIEDLTFSINEQLKEAEDHTSKTLNAIRSFSTERLAADEQVLEALSKLSSKAAPAKESSVNHSDLEKWFQSLAALRASEVIARTDAMIATASPISIDTLGEQGADLCAELQTLKDEIDSVVQMVIGHELRNPILKSLEGSQGSKRQTQQAWSRYLLSTLEYLIAQLDAATTRICQLRSFADALLELRALIAETNTESTKDSSTSTKQSTSQPPKRPTEHTQRKPSGPQTQLPAPLTSITQALRRLTLGTSTGDPPLLPQLSSLSSTSSRKLQSQFTSSEKAMLEILGKSLAPRQREAQAVLAQLYAPSDFATVRLSDARLEDGLQGLGKKIDGLAPRVSGAEASR